MWDQLDEKPFMQCVDRIIPTYVGSTESAETDFKRVSNHSHVCGINRNSERSTHRNSESFPRMWDQRRRLYWTATSSTESFPRMWDQPRFPVFREGAPRIIPTYVGSTRFE